MPTIAIGPVMLISQIYELLGAGSLVQTPPEPV
jgi:hypothetical protein